MTIRTIAQTLGKDPRTLQRWLRTGHPPWHHRQPRGSILAPYRAYLERRFEEGCCNAALLWRERREQGFPGRPSLVRVWIGRWKKTDPVCAFKERSPAPAGRAPSIDALSRMLTQDLAILPGDTRQLCERRLEIIPGLAAATAVAQRLVRMLQHESTEPLQAVSKRYDE
jgi:hypothetical protein